jgi:nitrogen fixation protein NifU and related proteins
MKYHPKLLQHFFNPKNVGYFDSHEDGIRMGIAGSYENGALIHFQIKLKDNCIEAAKFKAYGNGVVIGACSFVAEWVEGKTIAEASQLQAAKLVEELHIPQIKIHCALLVEDALKKTLGVA